MKKVISLILICFMLLPSFAVLAEEATVPTSGECAGGLFWEFNDGVLTISGEGEMIDYHVLLGINHGDAVYHDYPKEWNNFSISVVKIVIEEGVTKVGAYAFTDCLNLESVELKGVEVIGSCAFWGTKLNNLTLSDKLKHIGSGALSNTPYAKNNESIIMNDTLYWVSTGKDKYVVPDGIKTIAPYAFGGNIYEIVLPEGLEVIDNSAFESCYVVKINLPNSIKTIGDRAFYYSRNLDVDKFPESLETIGSYAFGYTQLSCSNLPDSVKYVGTGAFEDTHITEFTLKKGVTYGAYFICSCDNLTSVTIEDGVEVIPDNFLYWCQGITSITLPESLVSIGKDAFKYTSITEINIPDNVKYIGEGAFADTDIREFTMKKGISYGGGYTGVVGDCPLLEKVTIEDGVEVIPERFFGYSYNIKDVRIPDSVTSIGDFAFSGTGITDFKMKKGVSYGDGVVASCKNLVNVTIENGVTKIPRSMFSWCNSLEKVVLPKSCVSLGEGAFRACANLKTVVLGDSLERIGDSTFYQCKALESITIPRSVRIIDKHAFSDCESLRVVNLSSGLEEIGIGAFYNCKSLEKIVIPYKVTEIKENTFFNCESLKSVKIGAIKHIGADAFKNCKSLKNINLPKSIASVDNNPFVGTSLDCNDENNWETGCFYLNNMLLDVNTTLAGTVKIKEGTTFIAPYAFKNCTEIERVEIPHGIKEIPFEAFYNCTNLKSVVIPDSVKSIDRYAFYNCSSLDEIALPDSITQIGVNAFERCSALKEITIPKDVKRISHSAFDGCTMLQKVNLPEGLESIDSWAFYKNTSLESITIPESVKTIGSYAFKECSALKDVIYLGKVEDIAKDAF